MWYWKIYLKDGDEEVAVRSKYNIASMEEALNEVLDIVDYINLEIHKLGIDSKVDFKVSPQ